VHREDKKTLLILLTNNFNLSAERIADLYKKRWQVELFFKWIKQRLRIKNFIDNTKNSVVLQFVTALITCLLHVYYCKSISVLAKHNAVYLSF